MAEQKNRLIFATKNAHKMIEIRAILKDLPYEIQSMEEADIDIEVIEDGETFEANAIKKAKEISAYTKCLVLADDSGLEIDALNKEPGIYSARYMGENTPYPEKNARILERLKDVKKENRTARFVCAIAAVFPSGEIKVVKETMEGYIDEAIRGDNGFGYDPIFVVPEFGKTSAELSPEQKNRVSHRGKALRRMQEVLKGI